MTWRSVRVCWEAPRPTSRVSYFTKHCKCTILSIVSTLRRPGQRDGAHGQTIWTGESGDLPISGAVVAIYSALPLSYPSLERSARKKNELYPCLR